MVRSTVTSLKYGLTVTASALLLWQLPALAEDRAAEKAEASQPPLVTKAVPSTVLPPASDAAVASWRQWQAGGVPTVPMVRPAETPAIVQPRPEPVDTLPVMVQPAETPAIAQRPEPEKIPRDEAAVEKPLLPERRPPPVANAISVSPRPEPVKTRHDEALVAVPSLPGRSPFRQAPFKSEIVAVPADVRQPAPEPAPAKGTAVSRFFSNLLPGKKAASTQVASTAEGTPSSAGDNKAGQTEAGTSSDKPPIKRFIDGIQFWKN